VLWLGLGLGLGVRVRVRLRIGVRGVRFRVTCRIFASRRRAAFGFATAQSAASFAANITIDVPVQVKIQ
jgi:hypothetical protein